MQMSRSRPLVTLKLQVGGWTSSNVPQPGVIANYNKYINAVDRSNQILATDNIHRKCVRWWKTLLFHLTDIAIVNSYILFQEHCTNSPDEPASYSLTNFREEVVNGLCGFAEYGHPPPGHVASNLAPSSSEASEASEFVTEHIPCFREERSAGRRKKGSTKFNLIVKPLSVINICISQVKTIVSRYIIQRITHINVEILKNRNFHFL